VERLEKSRNFSIISLVLNRKGNKMSIKKMRVIALGGCGGMGASPGQSNMLAAMKISPKKRKK